MLPYQTLLTLDRRAPTTLAQQLSTALMSLIQQGIIPAGTRLPGARTLAALLHVHRQTVAGAFEELAAQGWLELRPARAPVVSQQLPEVHAQPLASGPPHVAHRAGFAFRARSAAAEPWPTPSTQWLDDGSPDSRLAPLAALARNYRRATHHLLHPTYLGYTDPNGSRRLRQQLSQYLRATRGVPADPEHIFTTRGSIMGLYLLAQLVLEPGDTVVVADYGYRSVETIFGQCGAQLQRAGLDEQGVVVDDVAALCQRHRVRLLYLTPHHHYPTTVTLSAARRMQLLHLAEVHDFIILEDDYDFDYHYESSPILPLASADRQGRVLYVGSLSKALSPAVRLGYVVAPPDIIAALGPLRRLVDRQGDALLEEAVAELLAEGELTRHLKRARQHYQQRRDACCQLLRTELSAWLSFSVPAGGLAIWGCWRADIDLPLVVAHGRRLGLAFSDGMRHQGPTGAWGLRLGFASLTVEEMRQRMEVLKQALQACYPVAGTASMAEALI
ncbi:aminotransferase class I/II-fold pyridoxal phosphate-dependent enzyme [Hymenobacter sp. HMF4947]|uniref:Aminotransferase class I/II-fold pyridoxal phosphate-dependent enzyme n=1 Tax=Hymenobacter ginkgonis TaxID=2682976 RepID=A0A7K1TGL2_9BACT|nr:PLP-dependent aminotransferase family protein [Hymenobacter ginkgonis]MVN77493.1 aminotransferase class I/II-fold pyridoxal phosphate-dependent enzyme [Hymenobacter ginkgonis]